MTEWYFAAFVTFLAGMFAGFRITMHFIVLGMQTGRITEELVAEARENYRMAQRLKVLQGRLK